MNTNVLTKVENSEQYEAVRKRVHELIDEATEKGMLESDADNEYTREIGRLSYIGAIYENEHIIVKQREIGNRVARRRSKSVLEYA